MTDPWGAEQPAAPVDATDPLPARLRRLAEVAATGVPLIRRDPDGGSFPGPDELPEVQALIRAGWRPLHGAPLYCLLPAAWPAEHRTWVPDRLPVVALRGSNDTYVSEFVAVPDPDRHDEFLTARAEKAGLLAPPPGRIWLLRSPWPRIPVPAVYDLVWSFVERDGPEDEIVAMYRVAADVLTWDEQRALAACPADLRDRLDAWAAAGRVGAAAADMIERRLHPEDVAAALRRTGLDEPTLLAWFDSLQVELDEDAVEFIAAWRASGLPGNPPPGAGSYRERDLDELATWLAAGFDLRAADRLADVGVAVAARWRDAGFDVADTYELLRADPELTPEEAHAFDGAGPVRERRSDWLYYGFSAARAAAWATSGLTPYQARLWRACGRQPGDVRPGQVWPPHLLVGRRYVTFGRSEGGEKTNAEWDEIADPPGTRGRHARRSSR